MMAMNVWQIKWLDLSTMVAQRAIFRARAQEFKSCEEAAKGGRWAAKPMRPCQTSLPARPRYIPKRPVASNGPGKLGAVAQRTKR